MIHKAIRLGGVNIQSPPTAKTYENQQSSGEGMG